MFRGSFRSNNPNRKFSDRYHQSASVLSFNQDGLEIARVKKRRKVPWLPVWHLVFIVYLGLLIRLIAMADLGPAAYGNRMAELESGTWIERMTAKIMFMDPVSRSIAVEVRAGLNRLGA